MLLVPRCLFRMAQLMLIMAL